MAAGGPTPPAPPTPPPASGASGDQLQDIQELIRVLQNFEREVRQTVGQSAKESTSSLLQDLSYDIERFGRDFVTELSSQFQKEMNALFEGGNLPGLGQAGERAGGLMGTALGTSIGAYFGGPAGARIGAMLGEAAGSSLVSAAQFLYEGAEMQGARRAPQIHAGMIPSDMSPQRFAVEGAAYREHIAKLEKELGFTAQTLDAAFTSVSQLGVAQDQEGRQLTARIMTLSQYINLNEATGVQLATRMMREYGQSIGDVVPELTDLRTYTQEWNSSLVESDSATARAFRSAMTLNEALSQVSAGARQSGASLSDLRSTAQSLLLLIGEMGRPEVTKTRATQIMQAITPNASVEGPGGEMGKSFVLKSLAEQTAEGRQMLDKMYKDSKPEEFGLPAGTKVPRSVFDSMINQRMVQSNLKGGSLGGYDPQAQSAVLAAGMMEMMGGMVTAQGINPAMDAMSNFLKIGGNNVDAGALYSMHQSYTDKTKSDAEKLSGFMKGFGPGRAMVSEDDDDLMKQAESRGEATVGAWKTATATLTEWTAGLAGWWNRFRQVSEVEEAAYLAMVGPIGMKDQAMDEATRNAYEKVGAVMEQLQALNEGDFIPTMAEQSAQMSLPDEHQLAPPSNRNTVYFHTGDVEAARGAESVRRNGASPTGGSSQHP